MRIVLILIVFIINSYGMEFYKKGISEAKLLPKSSSHWCSVCGNDLVSYYKTSYKAKLQVDGTQREYCSMHCLISDKKEYGVDDKNIEVFGIDSNSYIDPKKAFYVVGSNIYGVNSKKSKLAFLKKSEAKKFTKQYKGKVRTYEYALVDALKSYSKDRDFFKKVKNKRAYKRGETISKKACSLDSLDLDRFIEMEDLKKEIIKSRFCVDIDKKDLHDLVLYLWEVKRFGTSSLISSQIVLKEDDKCPVCGMFTYKYPRWAAQIFYEQDGQKTHYSFDGVKDLMKFYFNPNRWGNHPLATKKNISKLLVTDYYSQKTIDGLKAYFVIGSDIFGPMGNEYIPFKIKEDAQTFKKDHFGTTILSFHEITKEQTYKLDTAK